MRAYRHASPPTPQTPPPLTPVHPNAAQTLFANLIQAEISLSDLAWPHFLLHINLLGTRHSQCHSMSGGAGGAFTVKEGGKEGANDWERALISGGYFFRLSFLQAVMKGCRPKTRNRFCRTCRVWVMHNRVIFEKKGMGMGVDRIKDNQNSLTARVCFGPCAAFPLVHRLCSRAQVML